MNPEAWSALCELRGYVNACADVYQNDEGIPFTAIETIQKRIATIIQIEGEREP